MSKSQVIILGIVGSIILFLFAVVFLGFGRRTPLDKANIVIWGVESQDAFSPAIASFQNENKGVRIRYEQLSENSYEKKLIDALAAGEGPDIFMFKSNWLNQHRNKIMPIDATMLGEVHMGDLFPSVVEDDFVREQKIFAMPLYIDTLALVYNRSSFDKKAIPLPPRSWDEVKSLASKKNLSVSLGDKSSFVTQAKEIIMAMMLQAGVVINNDVAIRLAVPSGIKVLEYYLQFLPSEKDSITDFAGEKTDIIFDFYSSKSVLKAKNPFLQFNFSALPQFDLSTPVTVAKYYGLAVSNKSARPDIAWKFIIKMTTDAEISESYLQSANHPPALRSLISKYSDSREYGVFARQALIAKSWFESDPKRMSEIIDKMIETAVDKEDVSDALRKADSELNDIVD